MVSMMHRIRRRKQILQASSVAGAVLLVVFSLSFLFVTPPLENEQQMGQHGYSCKEFFDRAEDYVAGQLTDLASGKMDVHMGHCPKCRVHVEQLQALQDSRTEVPPVLKVQTRSDFRVGLEMYTEPKLMIAAR